MITSLLCLISKGNPIKEKLNGVVRFVKEDYFISSFWPSNFLFRQINHLIEILLIHKESLKF